MSGVPSGEPMLVQRYLFWLVVVLGAGSCLMFGLLMALLVHLAWVELHLTS